MMKRSTMTARAGALLAPLLLASCTGDAGEGAARGAPFNSGRQLAISDQLHNNGTAGFVFLPPMVPRPAYFGDFLPDLEPIVRIDEVRPDGTTVRTLATFTRDSGPGRERIRVHRQGRPCDPDDDDGDTDPNGYFYARWFTHNQHLSPSAVYRVRVFVQERVHPCTRNGWGRACRHGEDSTAPMREVGFADVDVVRNHHEARCVDSTNFVPLVNGRVLRIKFRIDRPVVDADGDGVYNWRDNCRTVANASQLDTNNDGEGDACECVGVTCTASDSCHTVGTCSPASGMCSNPVAPAGTSCALANAAGACTAGACGVATCNPGFANCDGSATNGCEQATTTLAHCGGCNITCASGAHSTPTCATGTCGLTCESGWADADGDRANGCELDITTDANCGAPGNACVSTAESVSTCRSGACSTMACAAGRANCNSAVADGCEVNTTNDASHCGACGTVCSVPNATPACTTSACTIGRCNAGFDNCNSVNADGCEVNTQTSLAHCGVCGRACSLANAAPVCTAGACAIASCNAGFADVDGLAANGCEVNLATDPSNCGAPGNVCSAANGTAGCAAGACIVASCNANFSDCDGLAANGCERDLLRDADHCGACGNVCPSGANSASSCAAGACVLTCAAGFANCDGDARNGCEINGASDGANCGACGNVCTLGRTCQAGACTATVCTAGLANCNGSETDGCEVTLATSVDHCGACGNVCSFANAAAECTAGTCGFSVCNPGFADVDGLPGNGCEVNLLTDVNHCGAVRNVCSTVNGTAACVSGACAVRTCNTGFGDCDGSAANGCEVDTQASVTNCGACGHACGAGQTCTSGHCVARCGAGLVDCAGVCRNLTDDNANCGACGNVCSSGRACVAGACVAACVVSGCDDGNPCTVDACDAVAGCRHTTNDRDHDGVPDACDSCPGGETFHWVNWTNPNLDAAAGVRTVNGTVGGVGVSYTSDRVITYTPNLHYHQSALWNYPVFPAQFELPASLGAPYNFASPASNRYTVQNLLATNNTVTFASPVSNPVLVFASIGANTPQLVVPVTFDRTVKLLWCGGPPAGQGLGGLVTGPSIPTTSSGFITCSGQETQTLYGYEGYAVVEVPGTHSSVTFNYGIPEEFANFVFGFNTCDP